MIRAHRIPTRRPFPRALTVICLFVAACVAAVVLSGCSMGADGRQTLTDDAGCQYTVDIYHNRDGSSAMVGIPRPVLNSQGHQVCNKP